MTTHTFSAAPAPSSRLRKLVLIPLLLSFAYAVTVLIRDWTPPARTRMFPGVLPVLHALLFQQGVKLDLYDVSTADGTVRAAGGAIQNTEEPALRPRLLSTRAVLLSQERHARVRSMTSAYSYDPLEGRESPLVLLSRNMNYTFSLLDAQSPLRLRVDFAGCGTLADILLTERPDWYEPARLFGSLHLPMQRQILLSPAETSLAIVDHDHAPRIILTDLIQRTARTLAVPSFDPEQLHFSPFFIDEETLLFSVLDRRHWGTVLYRLRTGTYETLSADFTDHAYHSLTGDVILRQSYFDDTINIPFGSIGILEQQQSIPTRLIETMTGPKENNAETFSLLFQKPEESSLHFRSDLTTKSFNAIAESDLREPLRTYWREYQLKLSHAVGTLRLLTLNPDNMLVQIETIPFEIRPPATFVQHIEHAEPLLRALKLPDSLIEEYRKRSAEAENNGDFYLLVDDLSY
ncbi:MAG: hypothetical protein V1876_03080 [Candidatus Peregrinibacteria bacterium]